MVDIDVASPRDEGRAGAQRAWAPNRKLLALGAGALLCLGVLFGESVGALALQAFDQVTDAYLVVWIDRAGTALGCF